MSNEAWRERAACKGKPNGWWYVERTTPGNAANIAQAKAICATCPVVDECLRYALENTERHGVWGGKTVRERQKLRKNYTFTRPCIGCGGPVTVRADSAWKPNCCGPECYPSKRNREPMRMVGRECKWCGDVGWGGNNPDYCGWICERSAQRDRFAKLMADVA